MTIFLGECIGWHGRMDLILQRIEKVFEVLAYLIERIEMMKIKWIHWDEDTSGIWAWYWSAVPEEELYNYPEEAIIAVILLEPTGSYDSPIQIFLNVSEADTMIHIKTVEWLDCIDLTEDESYELDKSEWTKEITVEITDDEMSAAKRAEKELIYEINNPRIDDGEIPF